MGKDMLFLLTGSAVYYHSQKVCRYEHSHRDTLSTGCKGRSKEQGLICQLERQRGRDELMRGIILESSFVAQA